MTKIKRDSSVKNEYRAQSSKNTGVSSTFIENIDFLKNFLKRFLSKDEDIEDVTQEAYLKAVNIENKSNINNPKAYLFRVAKNVALNELNRKSRQMTVYIEDRLASIPVDGKDTLEDELEAQQSVMLYYKAANALPSKCRRVFLLRKVNGMSHKEIAEHLGITISTVEKHLRNGTRSCRDYIRQANQPDNQTEQSSVKKGSQAR
jgi:RNA polymerase sigma-70 factor (ECF subfamily)